MSVRVDESASEDGPWTPLETVPLAPDPDPSEPAERHVSTDQATLSEGWYRLVVLDAGNDEGTLEPRHNVASAEHDIRVMVPRVRRAVEGVGKAPVLSDDDVKDLVADALAEVILYSGGLFGKELIVTERVDGIPVEYAVDPELSLPEETVVATQAALNHLFHQFSDAKTSERISNPAYEWEYAKSANLLQQQFQQLVAARDKALEAVADEDAPLDGYVSFLAVRDGYTAALVEPWTQAALVSGVGGQETFRGV